MPPLPQFPPQIATPGESSLWFEGLVTAVSKKIKDDKRRAAPEDVNKNAAPANLSIENKRALVSALRRQKEGELTMEQVFRELSQVCIRARLWSNIEYAATDLIFASRSTAIPN